MLSTKELVERLTSLADVIQLRTPNAYTTGDIDGLFYAAARLSELEQEVTKLREARLNTLTVMAGALKTGEIASGFVSYVDSQAAPEPNLKPAAFTEGKNE